jgi:predicted metal-dependent phosphoesterase TrpH
MRAVPSRATASTGTAFAPAVWRTNGLGDRVLNVDLHLHTSEDPADNIAYDAEAVIARAAARGLDAIAITLHDRQLASARLTAYARERGVVLIPGVERTIRGKHVLLLNFPSDADEVRDLDAVRTLKRRSNGLVVAPHPFFPGRTPLRSLLDGHADLFDAVEWSYFWTPTFNFNARAARWARAHGKPIVGNSDAHDIRQPGRTFSVVQAERDADAICAAIREGKVELRTSPVPPLELALVLGGMLVAGNKRDARLHERDVHARGDGEPHEPRVIVQGT